MILLLALSQIALAQEAVLSATLPLSIPPLRYQPQAANEQWLRATLDYVPAPNSQMLFAILSAFSTLPPSLGKRLAR